MTIHELSPEQLAEREKTESQYGGLQGASHNYGHLTDLLRLVEKRIREGYTPQIPKDEGYLKNLREKIMAQMRQLGSSANLSDYDEEILSLYPDLRE